jgi:hypothetical protein
VFVLQRFDLQTNIRVRNPVVKQDPTVVQFTATNCGVQTAALSQGMAAFIHLVVCLTTGPRPLPNRALHILQSSRFLLQMWVSSPFLKVIQQLPTFSSSSFCHFYGGILLNITLNAQDLNTRVQCSWKADFKRFTRNSKSIFFVYRTSSLLLAMFLIFVKFSKQV